MKRLVAAAPFGAPFLGIALVAGLLAAVPCAARTWHVSPAGRDDAAAGPGGMPAPGPSAGGASAPFRTISRAAALAEPGDTVLVQPGLYRERVAPARGGEPGRPIVYLAAPFLAAAQAKPARPFLPGPGDRKPAYAGEVWIKGSEEMKGWTRRSDGVHALKLDTALFGAHHPFRIAFAGKPKRSLGEIFVNGKPLEEADTVAQVAGKPLSYKPSPKGDSLYAHFGGLSPDTALVEVTVREQIFAPRKYHLGHIEVKGFHLEHAANQYPYRFYAEDGHAQKGALSTSGGHDWVLEGCLVRYVRSVGIDYGYQGADVLLEAAITPIPWEPNIGNRVGRLGHHRILNNTVTQCGTNGIIGMWGPYSLIEGNRIEYTNRLKSGMDEVAGLKTFYGRDGIIRKNLFRNNDCQAVWIDNNYQGMRAEGNIFIDNKLSLWSEMGHGPLLVDHNVFIRSPVKHSDGGGALMVQNLFIDCAPPDFFVWKIRKTMVWKPGTLDFSPLYEDSTYLAHNRYLNNVFLKKGITLPRSGGPVFGNKSDRNAFLDGAQAGAGGDSASHRSAFNTRWELKQSDTAITLSFEADAALAALRFPAPYPSLLGPDPRTGEMPDSLEADFTGMSLPKPPLLSGIRPGPFQGLKEGRNTFTLWGNLQGTTVGLKKGLGLRRGLQGAGPSSERKKSGLRLPGFGALGHDGLGRVPKERD